MTDRLFLPAGCGALFMADVVRVVVERREFYASHARILPGSDVSPVVGGWGSKKAAGDGGQGIYADGDD